MNYNELIAQIDNTHQVLQKSAVKAVNTHITLRNWLIGFYIVEFEQKGDDRAKYGSKLLDKIAGSIQIKGLTSPELSRCRQFYSTYKQLLNYLDFLPIFSHIKNKLLDSQILGSSTQEFEVSKRKLQTSESELAILGSPTQELQLFEIQEDENYYVQIFSQISYTHFAELIKIKEVTKRKFYELLIVKNTLSVTELQRQIATLTYERVGISQNSAMAFKELEAKLSPETASEAIKSIYVFDFVGLPNSHLLHETALEEALLNHLESFILELGNGFCFEARQKRILIDDEYCFVDIVFYHRLLKCHILIELKVDKFKHEHLSQLNSYVGYYKENIKTADDNPTIGILLCTEKGNKMVEYALAGMEEKLFVSKYLLQLPSKEKLTQFIENEFKNRQPFSNPNTL